MIHCILHVRPPVKLVLIRRMWGVLSTSFFSHPLEEFCQHSSLPREGNVRVPDLVDNKIPHFHSVDRWQAHWIPETR